MDCGVLPRLSVTPPNRKLSYFGGRLMVKAAPIHLRVLPETRGECRGGARPCPLVSCRFHLLLDVAIDGRLYKTRALDETSAESILDALVAMPETCALDVADRGGMFEKDVAELLNLGHSQMADIEATAQQKVRERGQDLDYREHPEDSYIRYMYPEKDKL